MAYALPHSESLYYPGGKVIKGAGEDIKGDILFLSLEISTLHVTCLNVGYSHTTTRHHHLLSKPKRTPWE